MRVFLFRVLTHKRPFLKISCTKSEQPRSKRGCFSLLSDPARDGDVAENRIGLQHALDVRIEVADRKGRFGSENWGEKVLHEKGSLVVSLRQHEGCERLYFENAA